MEGLVVVRIREDRVAICAAIDPFRRTTSTVVGTKDSSGRSAFSSASSVSLDYH